MEVLEGRKVFLKELNSLNDTWLKEVWILNQGIQRIVYDMQREDQALIVTDIMDELSQGSAIHSYDIDNYGHSYIKVNDKYRYLINLQDAVSLNDIYEDCDHATKGLLQSDIDDCIDLITAYDSVSKYRNLYDELEERIDQALKSINDRVIKRLELYIDEDPLHAYDMFCDIVNHGFYDTCQVFDDVYIKGGEGFTAYEDTTKDYLR